MVGRQFDEPSVFGFGIIGFSFEESSSTESLLRLSALLLSPLSSLRIGHLDTYLDSRYRTPSQP